MTRNANIRDEARRVDVCPPAVILCEPQLGENIGTAARAMANFGLTDLRIVNPRDGWPSDKARAAASRADHVIDKVQVFDSVEAAIADLSFVYATTARSREVPKPVRGPDEAAVKLTELGAGGLGTGYLFGRERWGLNNDEVALADEIVTLPVDPEFASLNIAQAVLVCAYEWRKTATQGALPFRLSEEENPPASKEDVVRFFEHIESALDHVTFFRPPERRPHMVRTLRNIFQKAQMTDQEVRAMRGVVAALEKRRTRPRPDEGRDEESAGDDS
ncbi:RNA methyltransferase [Roseibium polysiphoniae]|uniref:tRNA (cytidine/uridine-2'-O-)-methyltransferase TrmJ n=1 Tax=Roseibium polysiphoniae TaxID=2571221 RepID=A0ABR9C9B4_9HYPH|nr:RNA methyltransferase [Roseibium polysiphoniae]MBD8876496.1 RNA methyltransferase [Roseibium polysiphoniae]